MNKQFQQANNPVPPFDQLHEGNFEENTHMHHLEFSTSEGSEYLDDAIRMNDMQQGDTDTPTSDEIALYVSEPFNEPNNE